MICRRELLREKKILLRIDPDLHKGLKLWASDEFRSLNAHIEFLYSRNRFQIKEGSNHWGVLFGIA